VVLAWPPPHFSHAVPSITSRPRNLTHHSRDTRHQATPRQTMGPLASDQNGDPSGYRLKAPGRVSAPSDRHLAAHHTAKAYTFPATCIDVFGPRFCMSPFTIPTTHAQLSWQLRCRPFRISRCLRSSSGGTRIAPQASSSCARLPCCTGLAGALRRKTSRAPSQRTSRQAPTVVQQTLDGRWRGPAGRSQRRLTTPMLGKSPTVGATGGSSWDEVQRSRQRERRVATERFAELKTTD
jgi:hypothetical protein